MSIFSEVPFGVLDICFGWLSAIVWWIVVGVRVRVRAKVRVRIRITITIRITIRVRVRVRVWVRVSVRNIFEIYPRISDPKRPSTHDPWDA